MIGEIMSIVPTGSNIYGFYSTTLDHDILNAWILSAPNEQEQQSRRITAEHIQNFLNNPNESLLSLCNLGLTTLPRNFFAILDSDAAIERLTTLSLADNDLSYLPDGIGKCTQLKDLYLFDNQLTYLPEQIGNLTQLRDLNVANNKLTKLPKSLSQLTELRTINLNDNPLSTAAFDVIKHL